MCEAHEDTAVSAAILCLQCHEQGQHVWHKCLLPNEPTFFALLSSVKGEAAGPKNVLLFHMY